MVSVHISSASDRWFKPLSLVRQIVGSSPYRVEPKTTICTMYLLLLRSARSIKEKDQRRVGSESA